MFDNVKSVTVDVFHTLNYYITHMISVPRATELTIQTHENRDYPTDFDLYPTLLPDALLNFSPQLVKLTFSDLKIGNSKMELILQAFRSHNDLKHLKTIR